MAARAVRGLAQYAKDSKRYHVSPLRSVQITALHAQDQEVADKLMTSPIEHGQPTAASRSTGRARAYA